MGRGFGTLHSDLHMSRAELREVVDAPARQRIAREIASLEARLMERGVEF